MVRNISLFQYWWWKFGNLTIIFNTLWSPIVVVFTFTIKTSLFKKSLVLDNALLLIVSNKFCSFVALYRSPCQSQDNFAALFCNFKITLDLISKKNPFLLVVIGDFNARLSQWTDTDSSTIEAISLESITLQFGLYQIINELAHILENSS